MFRKNIFALVVLLAGITTTVSAVESNLLPNGDFSATNKIAGWSITIGHGQWVADDANNAPGSGSLELDMDEINSLSRADSSCFAVIPGAPYNFAGEGKVLTSTFGLQMSCYAYADTACTQAQYITNLSPLGMQSLDNSWAPLAAASGSLPDNAHSVQCDLVASVSPSNAFTVVRADNVYFNSSQPVTPVRLQSFDVD